MNASVKNDDTIAALATPSGRGGIGIIRVSGPQALNIAKSITHSDLEPRYAHFKQFYGSDDTTDIIDQGIALFFPAPHSFTGEDVLELQGHGGPIIMDCLLRQVLHLGARQAEPGEFSLRAFLNNKIDLTQAEAIADLIDSSSEQAASNAIRSLQGEFSSHIHKLVEQIIELRLYVEAAIDFPEEEIDFINDDNVLNKLKFIQQTLHTIFTKSRQGALLRDGMSVVIAGKPNAGKSSLLNTLAEKETAIVTTVEGTTRDVLREHIQLDGMPLHIIDTAGLRDSGNEIEQEGIRRAWMEIEKADQILLVLDGSKTIPTDLTDLWPENTQALAKKQNITVILNKCDLSKLTPGIQDGRLDDHPVLALSAKEKTGIDSLRVHLKSVMGFKNTSEGEFSARRRHLQALQQAKSFLESGLLQLQDHGAAELLADDLRCAQQALGEITGEFSPDDLLGKIFSSFCIGK